MAYNILTPADGVPRQRPALPSEMKTRFLTVLMFAAASLVAGDGEPHAVLEELIRRSELIVEGEIIEHPMNSVNELVVVTHSFTLRVTKVLCGDKPEEDVIRIGVKRFEQLSRTVRHGRR